MIGNCRAALRMLSGRLRVGDGRAASPGRSPSERKDGQDEGLTPLGQLIEEFDYCVDYDEEDEAENRRQVSRSGLEIMKLLLKAGASLDRCERDLSAEAAMQEFSISPPKLRQRRVLRQVPRTRGRRPRARQLQGLCAGAASPVPPPALSARPRSRQDGQPRARLERLLDPSRARCRMNGACWRRVLCSSGKRPRD